MADPTVSAATDAIASAPATGDDQSKKPAAEEFEDEVVVRKREAAELDELISPDVKRDIGASATGLYDLVGE
jgi:ubiquitin carboxyl-terminal hydrolase 14